MTSTEIPYALFLSGIAIVISIVALFQTRAGWTRQRSIYNIERVFFFRPNEIKNESNQISNNELAKKLISGKYTILNTKEYGGYIELILGKIEK